MCWYTMLGVPDLATFGEPCDNHANCLDEYDVHNKDPRADDTKPYACALYSFCPDHCCPMKHIWYMKDCYQSQSNPCYAENQPGAWMPVTDRIFASHKKLIYFLARLILHNTYCIIIHHYIHKTCSVVMTIIFYLLILGNNIISPCFLNHYL